VGKQNTTPIVVRETHLFSLYLFHVIGLVLFGKLTPLFLHTKFTDMYSIGIIIYEIYSRKSPYEGEDFRETLRKICDRRVNKRPPTPEMCPPKMVDLMKKCWSPDPDVRPKAKDLDLWLMDMNSRDAEPVQTMDGEAKPKSGDMLHKLFPPRVADVLKRGEKVEPETHENVTVIFSETVNFADMTRSLTPLKISQMLDRLYLAFDKVASQYHVFKVETVGDAYMGVTNLENDQDDTHVKNAAEFAMAMVQEASTTLIDPDEPELGCINIRVGFHSGPVVSNVIGSLNPRYGLFGDTVNTASRMGTCALIMGMYNDIMFHVSTVPLTPSFVQFPLACYENIQKPTQKPIVSCVPNRPNASWSNKHLRFP